MSTPKFSPASVRYLKAKLRILRRPMVWGSAAILFLMLFSVYTLLQRPEWLTVDSSERVAPDTANSDQNTAQNAAGGDPNALPPVEDNAIGMDIDSLPVLLSEINGFNTADADSANSQPEASTNPQNQLQPPVATTTSSPLTSGSPAVNRNAQGFSSAFSQNERPLSLDLFNRPTLLPEGSDGSQGDVSANSGAMGNQPGTTAPLQTAVEQSSASSRSASSQEAQPSNEGQAASPTGSAPTVPSASTPVLPARTTGLYGPQTAPPPGTTGYTVPPSLIYGPNTSSIANPYRPQPTQGLQGLPQAPQIAPTAVPFGQSSVQTPAYGNSGYGYNPYNNSNIQPQISQPNPAPFTVPNQTPGRQFRGGYVPETFSNP